MNRPVEARPMPPLATAQPRPRRAALPIIWPLLAATIMLLIGVVMRAPTAGYAGPPNQGDFNNYIFQYFGAYSDISSLYFRDQLWQHPAPYFGYRLEYPVGMGVLIWLLNFFNGSVMAYLLATAVVMIICGLLVVWLTGHFEGANPWLLALSPTLPLYVVLNWDLFGVLLTVAALLLFRRNRDGWGGVLLAAAVWTKFFPIVLVPLVLLDRVLQRRWRDAFVIAGIFGAVSVVVNAPFAIQFGPGGVQLRDTWLFFFQFNSQRPREVNFWNWLDPLGLSLKQINFLSALLLALGVGAIMACMAYRFLRGARPTGDLLVPASLAAIAWFFFINKVYSPQYSLWLAALLALLAAPPALAVAFGSIDVVYFAASFILLYLLTSQNPAASWFYNNALIPGMTLRELAVLALVCFAVWRILQPNRAVTRMFVRE